MFTGRADEDGGVPLPADAIVAGPCPMALGDATDVAATPRAEVGAELVALRIDAPSPVARTATYERVRLDLAAVRAGMPELADLEQTPWTDGKTLDVHFRADAYAVVRAGGFHAWDCLNDFYQLTARDDTPDAYGPDAESARTVRLTFKGRYNVPRLQPLFEQLPGVSNTDPSGSNPTSQICASRDGSTHFYAFDRAGGYSCGRTGCSTHQVWYFVSDAPGQVELLDYWDNLDWEGMDPTASPLPEAGAPPPWYEALCHG
jgi:hypothetical protein